MLLFLFTKLLFLFTKPKFQSICVKLSKLSKLKTIQISESCHLIQQLKRLKSIQYYSFCKTSTPQNFRLEFEFYINRYFKYIKYNCVWIHKTYSVWKSFKFQTHSANKWTWFSCDINVIETLQWETINNNARVSGNALNKVIAIFRDVKVLKVI